MPKTARYVRDNKGFAAFAMSDGVGDFAEHVAEDIVAVAIGNSPASGAEKGSSDGTRFKDHFSIHRTVVAIKGKPRQAARIDNDAEYAAQVEFGFGPNARPQGGSHGEATRPLGRAAALFGDWRGGIDPE